MVQFFMPIIDGLAGLFLTMIETAKGYFSLKIAKYNKELVKSRDDDVPEMRTIGFTFEEEENQEEDEDE